MTDPEQEILTEFSEETETLDDGVAKEVEAEESFSFHGETVERTTKLAILEDGGVGITQRVQGCRDSLTLGSDVVDRLVREVENDG